MPGFRLGIMLILVVSAVFDLLPSASRDTYGIAGDPITGFYIIGGMLQNIRAAVWDGARERPVRRPPSGIGPSPLDRKMLQWI